MNTADEMWSKLAGSKKYREEFALSILKRSVAFQIKTLRKKRCGSQAVLAERAEVTQGVVSRAEDQDYGNLTFNTVGRIAGGLDMAFIGRFVSFTDLVRFSLELSEKQFAGIPTFEEQVEQGGLETSQRRCLQGPEGGPSGVLPLGSALRGESQSQCGPEACAMARSQRSQEQPWLPLLPSNVTILDRREQVTPIEIASGMEGAYTAQQTGDQARSLYGTA